MTIKIQAAGGKRAEILIHEPIGENWYGDGLTSRRFAKDLAALGEVDEILVRINSPGGAVFDSIAIYNALKSHGARIDVLVEGLAASGASIIAMAGTNIQIATGAMFMIHNPWTIAMGEADELREVADMLDTVADSMIDIYQAQTGLDRKELKSILDAETWYGASAAVEKGFADEAVGDATEDDDTSKAKYQPLVKSLGKQYQIAAAAKPLTRSDLLRFEAGALTAAASFLKSASAGAIRNEGDVQMSKEVASALTADDVKKAAEAAAAAARKAETERRGAIRTAFGKFSSPHRELLDACLDDLDCTAEAAQQKLLAKLGEGATPAAGAGAIVVTQDERDKFLAGAENAILVRAGLAKPEAGNEFRGMGIADLAIASLRRANIPVAGLTRSQVASRVFATHTTSDFPNLLSNTAGKVLRKAYSEFPLNWKKCFAKGSVSDFKVHPRIQVGSFASLATIAEGGEYSYGSTAEEYENASAVTKGKAIQFTRQMLINDDLGGFLNRASQMGRAAARTVNSDAFSYLISGSSGHGPTMADTGQMFNATAVTTAGGHANLTSSGTAISVASIGVGRTAMRKQKDKALVQTLNIEPKVLLCSVLKEDLANEIVKSRTKDGQSNSNIINVHENRVEVVSDPVIDGLNSGLSWYLLANPLDVPALEVVFLDGVEEPFIDERIEFSTDALDLKVRLDYGVANGDWRGAYKNVGA
jgi:ATP-dependent protease ClpP protease subunit